jgi:hypothetical protein
MDDIEIALVLHSTAPIVWAVEAVNSDREGGIEMTQFSGPYAEQRARDYATWRYGVRAPVVMAD